MRKILIAFAIVIMPFTVAPVYAQPSLADNFYQSINDTWLKDTTISDSDMSVSSFYEIHHQKIIPSLKAIFENPSPTTGTEKRLRNMYVAFMDMKKRNALGDRPIRPYLQAIDAVKNHHDVALLMSHLYNDSIDIPIGFFVDADPFESTTYVLNISQSGISLNREHYLNNSERAIKQRESYKIVLSKLYHLAGYKNNKQRVTHVFDIETNLAQHQFSPVEMRDMKKTNTPYTFVDVEKTLNNWPVKEMFQYLHIATDTRFIARQASYLQALNGILTQHSIEEWQDYLRARVLMQFAALLSDDFRHVLTERDKRLGIIKKEASMSRQGIDMVSNSLPLQTGRAYVEHNFDEKSKHYVQELVESIQDEFRFAIAHSSVFGDQTKKRALEKLDKMIYNIGYPDHWRDFSTLDIRSDDLVGNVIRINHINQNYYLDRLHKKVDRMEWDDPAYQINAGYNPNRNKFFLMAGILNKPFFDIHATDAQNYGGIGSVIAHEIGHAFDDMGSQFDGDGNLNNWWTNKDRAAFNKLKDKLALQIKAYEPYPKVHLNPALVMGETIGDVSGSQIAFGAYRKQEKNRDNYKSFFVQYAKIWRIKNRLEYSMKLLETDPHPPGEFRANNSLRNIDDFYTIFDIKTNDKMYRKPSERVNMW